MCIRLAGRVTWCALRRHQTVGLFAESNQLKLVFLTTMYASVKQGVVTSVRDISSSLQLSKLIIHFEIVIRISESSTLHQYRPFWLHIHFACTFLLQVCAETTLATSTYHSCSWQQPLRLRVSSRILLGL